MCPLSISNTQVVLPPKLASPRHRVLSLFLNPTNDRKTDPHCSLSPEGIDISFDRPGGELVHTFRFSGAIVGLISVGYLPIWLVLFPIAMAATIVVVKRRNWLAPIEPAQYRKGLLFELSAGLGVPLLFCVFYLGLILVGGMIGIFVSAYARIPGVVISSRRQEAISLGAAALAVALGWVLFYWGLQTLALRRFTRAWHPWLFTQMIAWTCLSTGVAFFVGSLVNWDSSSLFGLAPLWPIVAQWVVSVFLVSQLGALFGRWLARANRSLIQPRGSTSL